MSQLSEITCNDLRRIGGKLSRLSFELSTVVGISDQDGDEYQQQQLTEAMNHVKQATQALANLITNQPHDAEEYDNDLDENEDVEPYEEPLF